LLVKRKKPLVSAFIAQVPAVFYINTAYLHVGTNEITMCVPGEVARH